MKNEYKPQSVTSPHEILQEVIEEKNIQSKELENIVKNKTIINENTALKIQDITDIPCHFWLEIKNNFNKHKRKMITTKEEELNIAVADYLSFQYPSVLFCHVANERRTNLRRGGILKRMGVRRGMPDVMIFKTRIDDNEFGLYVSPGIAIELKIKPNRLTKNQREVLDKLSKEKWVTKVCYSFDEAKEFIDEKLKLFNPSKL